MSLEFIITPQGRRALELSILPSLDLNDELLSYIEVNEPVTLKDIQESFPMIPLRISAAQLLTMRRMSLVEQQEV